MIENKCPVCGSGVAGQDSLCDKHYRDYLGTHCGSRSEDAKEYKEWVEAMREEEKEKNKS